MNTAIRYPSAMPARSNLYGVVNTGFIVYMFVAAAFGSGSPRLLYLALLFALCSSPLLFQRRLNDRYSLYTIFLGIYFVSYGVLDLAGLGSSRALPTQSRLLSRSELLILLGGAAFVLGYRFAATRAERRGVSQFAADDWPLSTLVIIGFLLWSGGTFASLYWGIVLTVRSLEVNYASEGVTTLLMLGRYAQPLGILILAYAATISRSRLLWLLMVVVVASQVVLGFVSNTKGGAMLGGILVIVTSFLVKGKIPKGWLVVALLFVTIAFPIFQAYRTVVVGERGLTNAEAAQNIGQALELAIEGQRKATSDEGQASFFERSSVKSAVELIVRRTGVDVPYQHGHTLVALATAFIPRLIWPDKPGVETGLIMNQEFHLVDAIVYLSPSHLGELYWNFGWTGALGGMLLLGLLLGWINSLCDLSTGISVTRVLLLSISIFEAGVRFEGAIAGEYEIWARSAAGILILHKLLARRGLRNVAAASGSMDAGSATPDNVVTAQTRFPNLMA